MVVLAVELPSSASKSAHTLLKMQRRSSSIPLRTPRRYLTDQVYMIIKTQCLPCLSLSLP